MCVELWMMDFTKLDQRPYIHLCRLDFKLLTSLDPHSHAAGGDLLCHICDGFHIGRRKQGGVLETPDPECRDPRSTLVIPLAVASLGKSLNFSGHLSFTTTKTWGSSLSGTVQRCRRNRGVSPPPTAPLTCTG